MRNAVSGLKNKQEEQSKECSCACNGLVLEMLQAMTAQSNLMTEQNKLMALIIDQNNELIALSGLDEDSETKSRYLDG